jgi:hypothetical protein
MHPTKQRFLFAVLAVTALGLGACAPAPTPIGPYTVAEPAYSTKAICEAARTAPAASSCPLLTTDAGCTASCKANWWYTVGHVISASSITGQACYPVPGANGGPEQFTYQCVQTAQCQCASQ